MVVLTRTVIVIILYHIRPFQHVHNVLRAHSPGVFFGNEVVVVEMMRNY